MADLSKETVIKLAQLAKLELDHIEVEYYKNQLSHVVSWFSELDKIETSPKETWLCDVDYNQLLERKDFVEIDSAFKAVIEDAPKTIGTSFQVPRIIE